MFEEGIRPCMTEDLIAPLIADSLICEAVSASTASEASTPLPVNSVPTSRRKAYRVNGKLKPALSPSLFTQLEIEEADSALTGSTCTPSIVLVVRRKMGTSSM